MKSRFCESCNKYYDDGMKIDESVVEEVYVKLAELENVMEKKFGDPDDPLLVSVRSGSPISMPGMMDTILNLGLNDDTVKALAKLTNNERFAYDSYRRFIQMFGDVVQTISKKKFDKIFDAQKEKSGAEFDVDLTTDDLKEIIVGYKELVEKEMGTAFPQDPKDQMMQAITAVFRSCLQSFVIAGHCIRITGLMDAHLHRNRSFGLQLRRWLKYLRLPLTTSVGPYSILTPMGFMNEGIGLQAI